MSRYHNILTHFTAADDAYRSKSSGILIQPDTLPKTCADGLLPPLANLTWPIVRDLVDEIFTVSEQEIKDAMKIVFERMKVVIEPSTAVGVAAVLSENFQKVPEKRIVVVLCGGNVDLLHWKFS